MTTVTAPTERALLGITHFERYPQMVPWVGERYDKPGWKRILFIGESHYLPEKSTIHTSAARWYESTTTALTDEEAAWTNIRKIIGSGTDQRYKSKAHGLFANIGRVLLAVGFEQRSRMLDYAAFYNFFQRPALTGKSLAVDALDIEIAAVTFRKVVAVLEPELVCVVSRLAWLHCHPLIDALGPSCGFVADFFLHPGSAWWNTKSSRYQLDDSEALTGREKLRRFLKVNCALL